MERTEFLKASLEDKLIAIFDRQDELSKQFAASQKHELLEKSCYKINEIAAFTHKAYCTVDRAIKTLGVNTVMFNGVRAVPRDDVQAVINLLTKKNYA